ncbi:Plasma membrane fusion prm1 [Hyphodiscus hymeniophilus]|uniref:Plasma membrane fusion protein PRM1 n=1 Tax=Hyphodiscus hymeniophilus TaxID=353542 RepID=A0A9P7B154_9HELO|nr:Plasma membrane fusion prm1 [Hyphodiscus hymeniophilus]
MSSARNQQGFPAVPSTLNAGDHEMRDYYTDHSEPPNTAPYYTPYLGLRARLSQVWINRWTILLALILCRLLLSIKDINYDIANAKSEALSACTSVENVGSAMASMPHYLSDGVNALAADGVTSAVNGLMDMLMLTVTGVEEIILFVINMMTSTYVCLITLAITGSLEAAIQMIEDVGNAMNKSINSITGTISGDLSGFESDLNGFLSDLNVGGLFGNSKSPPSINLTSQINALNSIQIDPTTLDADLTKLNNSLPTFAQVQNFTNTVISFPFEEVKKLINESMSAYTFDSSIFPIPEKQALTFCSDNPAINNFFEGLVKVIYEARKIFIIVLIILAVLACIPMAYREIWRWRTMQQRSLLLQKHAFDPMDVIYIASRPYTTTAGIKAASKFKSTKRQILTRWFVAYATSLPALFVLALGVAGLFSCLCQYIVLKTIEKEVPILANEVGDFANTVVLALNNASEAWAVSANDVINSTNTKVNSDVFGWVNITTNAVNDTLNAFQTNMTSALNETFGGTVLYQPILGVFNCLVGLKIASFEKGLTWVSDNAHVDFPEFRPDVFSLGAAASITNSSATDSFLSSPGNVASDDITNAVVKVADKLKDAIREEAIISTCVVGVWFLIVLIGLCRAIFAMLGRDKTRAEGGPVGYTGDNRVALSPRSPNRNDMSKFPTFGGPVSSVYPQFSNEDMHGAAAVNEKVGSVGHRSVEASVNPGHERSSSYGYLDGKH